MSFRNQWIQILFVLFGLLSSSFAYGKGGSCSAAFSDFSRFNPSEQAYLHRLFLWAGNRNAANSNGLFDTTGRPQESLIVELDQSPPVVREILKSSPPISQKLMDWYFQDLSKSKQFSGIGKEQIAILVEELAVLQLENKCKVCCPWCAFSFNQKEDVYNQMSVPFVRTLIYGMDKDVGEKFRLFYYESDPLSYSNKLYSNSLATYSYGDIHSLYNRVTGNKLPISTVIPKGSEDQFFLDLQSGKISMGNTQNIRLSLSHVNEKRIASKIISSDSNGGIDGTVFEKWTQLELKSKEQRKVVLKNAEKLTDTILVEKLKKQYSPLGLENPPIEAEFVNFGFDHEAVDSAVSILRHDLEWFLRNKSQIHFPDLSLHSMGVEEMFSELSSEQKQSFFAELYEQYQPEIDMGIFPSHWFLNSKIKGDISLVSYVESLQNYRIQAQKEAIEDLESQFYKSNPMALPNMYITEIKPQKAGRAIKNEKAQKYLYDRNSNYINEGISCMTGVILHPDWVANTIGFRRVTSRYPDGMAIVKIEAGNFTDRPLAPAGELEAIVKQGVVRRQYTADGDTWFFHLKNPITKETIKYKIFEKEGTLFAISFDALPEKLQREKRIGKFNKSVQSLYNALQSH